MATAPRTPFHPLAAGLLAAAACCSPVRADTCATVEVQNVRPKQGHLMLAAFNSADTFNKKPLAALRVPAGEALMRIEVCGLAGAEVALTLFQDIDSNGKLDRNIVGLPTEPWGSSGQPGSFGPAWDTGKVALDGRPIVVKMSL